MVSASSAKRGTGKADGAHLLIVRVVVAEAGGDLLRRPALLEQPFHGRAPASAAGELGDLRSTCAAGGDQLGLPATVAAPAAVGCHLARDGRGPASQAAGDRAPRLADQQSAADLLALDRRQAQCRALPDAKRHAAGCISRMSSRRLARGHCTRTATGMTSTSAREFRSPDSPPVGVARRRMPSGRHASARRMPTAARLGPIGGGSAGGFDSCAMAAQGGRHAPKRMPTC